MDRHGHLTRRLVLGGLFAAGAGTALGAPVRSLRPRPRFGSIAPPAAAELIERAGLDGHVGYVVADMRTGETLESRAAEEGQPPASTAKTLTALYALDRLGPAHRFRTRLLATGPIVDGRLEGDLILAGGGDPTLDSRALGSLAASLSAAGVREVAGAYRLWAGALPRLEQIDPSQPAHVSYNPALSGLNLNFNRVHFGWERAGSEYEVTMDARAGSYVPEVTSARMKVIDRSGPVYTYSAGDGIDEWTVARGALGQGGARWLPVRNPALYAGEVFQILARSRGLALPTAELAEAAPEQPYQIAAVESAPLEEILREMLRYSNNMTAECVGLAASAADGDIPESLTDSAMRMNRWVARAAGGQAPALTDHSGLGEGSRISPHVMVDALITLGAAAPLPPLLEPFAIDQDVPANVNAKTGTLNFVSALAGYLTAPSGRPLAFAIFTSDLERRAGLTVAQRERPEGGRVWLGRSRNLQRALLERWAVAHA